MPLPFDEYVGRDVQPEWHVLPKQSQYRVLESVAKLEQGQSAFVNLADAEECLDMGWIEPRGQSGWKLTDSGRKWHA